MNHAEATVSNEISFPIFSVFGHKSELSIHVIRSCVLQVGFPLFLGLVVGIMVLFDGQGYVTKIGIWPAIVVWSTFVVLVAALYWTLLLGLLLLTPRVSKMVVYLPLVGFVAMAITTFAITHLVTFFTESGDFWVEARSNFPFNFSVGLIFETLFFVFVKPVLARNYRKEESESDGYKGAIRISGQNFQIEKIRYLQAQDHYVKVYLEDGNTLIRARLRDFTSQLAGNDGVKPHRSYWISWRAIHRIEFCGSHSAITLVSGEEVPIAKSRISEIAALAKARNIPISTNNAF